MTSNPQGRAASELSASLVRDYRAIITSLEQTKGEEPSSPTAEPASTSEPSPDRTMAEPVIRSARPAAPRPAAGTRPIPMGFAELRSKLAALSDARDIVPSRRPAEGLAVAAAAGSPAAVAEAADIPASRRRMIGAAARADAEPAARRRRAGSGEAFTWQRLGLLAICIAAAGGAAVALQSVVGRDEARVSPEAIGNAAIASVAPSALVPAAGLPPAPTLVAAAEPDPVLSVLQTPPPAALPASRSAPPAVPTISARALLAPELAEPGPAVKGLTAFAATESSPLAAVPEVKLPRQAPLPPPAPTRHAAATPAAAPGVASAADDPAEPVDATDEAGAASGGDPVGSASIRSPVTMRSGPNKGAAAMVTLKSGQRVDLVACDSWCEVVAEGKRGFVYKSYVTVGTPKEADAAPTAAE